MKKGVDYIGVGVGGIIVNCEGQVFLSQRGRETRNEAGKWEFPGGGVEFGEKLEEALTREIREEYGFEIEPVKQLWACDHLIPAEGQHWVSPTYLCRIKSGEPRIMEPHKCSQIGWFTLQEIGKMPISIITKQDHANLLKYYPDGLPNQCYATKKYGTKEEKVDILLPPTFEKSGKVKPLSQAWKDGDWLGTFCLWIVQKNPRPALLYQVRSAASSWAPNKLDVTAGGHYRADETMRDGLREVFEELGKKYVFSELTFLGRKAHFGADIHGKIRSNMVDLFIIHDDSPLENYVLEKKEVTALLVCPLEELIKAHTEKGYSFSAGGIDNCRQPVAYQVNKDSFPENWDNFHFKSVLLAERFLKGERNIIY